MMRKFQISNFKFLIANLLAISYLLLSTASPVNAQVPVNSVFKTPFNTFGELVTVIISNLYVIAGIVILFLIIFGGFGIISGAGGGDQQKVAQGKQALTSALIGFLIIFSSYWIIQIVKVITGVDVLNPGTF